MLKKLVLFTSLLLLAFSAVLAQKSESNDNGGNDSQLTFFAGSTSVHLSQAFRGALGTLQIRPGAAFPGSLRGTRASFPIAGGTIDADTLRGEIIHVGGLTLTRGTTRVKLENFIIDTTGTGGIVLTGQVSANGNIVGRIPLFNLTLPAGRDSFGLTFVRIDGVGVTLRQEAATALNSVFQTTAFTAGFNIGTASVNGFAFEN